MNLSFCSNGERVSEATIQRRYSQSLKEKHEYQRTKICECCGKRQAMHNDHTIAKARCKVIHKAELIWNPGNYVSSCEICHKEWESFKSGNWTLHLNSEVRLRFLKEHDPEGYNIRIELTVLILQQQHNRQTKGFN
jgi:hypothetical protein